MARLQGIEINNRVRRAATVVGVLVVGVMLGAALHGARSSSADKAVSQRSPSMDGQADETSDNGYHGQATGAGPSSSVAGVGVGFEHSERGAIAAAMSYTAAPQSWLYLSDEDLKVAVEAVTAPGSRDQLVGTVVEDLRMLRDQLTDASGTVWFVVSPLATKLESYDDDHAVVRVWAVRVLSADGVAIPQAGWRTVTLHLEWGDGGQKGRSDWLVADVSEIEGPTPQLEAGLQPWSAGYLDATLAGFLRVGAL